MRRSIGLPSPERKIGLAAHDFYQLAATKRVALTRSKRTGGGAAKPSRWLVRLRNVLTGAGALARTDRSAYWREIARELDAPAAVSPIGRTCARAGRDRRPRRLSVTQIEKWLRDPYAVYARNILKLRPLDPPGLKFGPREMGVLLHAVFAEAAGNSSPANSAGLMEIFDRLAGEFGLLAENRTFHDLEIAATLEWFSQFDAERRALGAPAVVEGAGALTIGDGSGAFTLSARADRIDVLSTGAAAIFDYKTGRIPTARQIRTFSPQLALTAAIVERGGFQQIGPIEVEQFDFIKVFRQREKATDNVFSRCGADAEADIAISLRRLSDLVEAFDRPDAVYHSQPRPQYSDDYGDYDQLAQRGEWAAIDGGDAE